MKVLVDTPVWSLALRRHPQNLNPDEIKLKQSLTELVNDGRVAMLGLIRQELLTAIREPGQFSRLRERLQPFPDIQLQTADFERAAEISNECASRGLANTPADMLICSVAATSQLPILTTDGDFLRYSKVLPIRLFEPRSA